MVNSPFGACYGGEGQESCSHQAVNTQWTLSVVLTFTTHFLCGCPYSWLGVCSIYILTGPYFIWENSRKCHLLECW